MSYAAPWNAFHGAFFHSRDVLIQLRALWELNVAKSGAFGDPSKNTEVKVEEGGEKEQAANQRCDFCTKRIVRTNLVLLLLFMTRISPVYPLITQRINSWWFGGACWQGVATSAERSEWRF
jgi:hypothetical protein